MSRVRAARAAPYALVAAGAGYLFHVATQISYQARVGTLGPDFWPKLLLLLLIAVCAYEIVRILAFDRRPDIEGSPEALVPPPAEVLAHAAPGQAPTRPWLLAAGVVLTALYVATLQTLGFFTATCAYLAAFVVLGGYRRARVVAAVSIAGTFVILFFFMKVVYVSLPLGAGPFRQLTLFLMQILGIR